MALIKRTELPSHLKNEATLSHQIYLIFGERFLCKEAADLLQEALLSKKEGTVHPIDGDAEDTAQTLARLQSFSLLPGLQIHRVTDTRLFHTKQVGSSIWNKALQSFQTDKKTLAYRHLISLLELASLSHTERFFEINAEQWQSLFGFSKPPGDISWADEILSNQEPKGSSKSRSGKGAGKYVEALTHGLPEQNLLILTTETVDKRKKLFNHIKKKGFIIDCSVAGGASSAAQKSQKSILQELAGKTLRELKKKMEPGGLDILFEKVGFHPVAVVMETEKLALAVGERELITRDDLEKLVGRSREDALFELTDHFGKKQLDKTLITLNHLLDNGIHALAILATMRNYLRRLLIFRSLQSHPSPLWHKGMNAKQFQERYLPALKATDEWNDLLGGHPYALFMSFSKAAEFPCSQLKNWLTLLLEAEFRLKSSSLSSQMVLEELFINMMKGKKSVTIQQHPISP